MMQEMQSPPLKGISVLTDCFQLAFTVNKASLMRFWAWALFDTNQGCGAGANMVKHSLPKRPGMPLTFGPV
jgi:hypothetical protein